MQLNAGFYENMMYTHLKIFILTKHIKIVHLLIDLLTQSQTLVFRKRSTDGACHCRSYIISVLAPFLKNGTRTQRHL